MPADPAIREVRHVQGFLGMELAGLETRDLLGAMRGGSRVHATLYLAC
jgi:hypothetical protein